MDNKEVSPVKSSIYDKVNKHMIMQMHLKVSKMLANNQHAIREVQKVISHVI